MHFNLDNRIRTRLRIRHLELLDGLGEGLSIHGAAARLHLTQPAVTKMLQDVEEIYGAQLFDRQAKGLRPTLPGEAAIRWARLTLNGIGESFSEIKAVVSGASGLVRVGAQIVAIPTLLARAVTDVASNYPEIIVRLTEGAVQNLLQLLANNEIDVVVSRLSPAALQPPFHFEQLHEQTRFCIVVRAEHPLAKLPTTAVSDFQGYRWMLPPEPAPIRQEVAVMLSGAGIQLGNPALETSSYLATELILRDTDLICPLPFEVAHLLARTKSFVILPIDVPIFMPPIGVIWNPSLPARPVLETFKKVLRDVAARKVLPDGL